MSIVKNTSLLTGSYIIQKILAFVYFTLIARWLSPGELGSFVFAISLSTIFTIFIDLGLTPILIRDTSKYQEKGNEYLNGIISIKLILSLLSYIFLILVTQLVTHDQMTKQMVYLSGIVMVIDSFTLSFWGIFRSYQKLFFEAKSTIINQIIVLAIGVVGLWFNYPLYILVIALMGGSFFSFLYSLILIIRNLRYKITLSLDVSLIKKIWKEALPFAFAGIFNRAYSYIDQIMIAVMIGNTALGFYSVPYKITFALQFIPSAFVAAIYPAMSNYFEHSKEKLARLFEKSMFAMMITSIPIAFGTIAIADQLILTVYTEKFINSIIPLQILIFSVIAVFLSFPVGSMLNACHKQHLNTINLGITMLINFLLNLILIPKYQQIGAAIAATISLYYMFISNFVLIKSIVIYNQKYLLNKFFLVFIASGVMSVSVYLTKPYLGLAPSVLMGGIIYILMIYLLKIITKEEINEFKASFKTQAAPVITPEP